jgi:cysteine desulfurase
MARFYFDHNATTPLDDRVASVLAEALQATYGNASSIHREGQQARQLLEQSRRRIAGNIGANPAEIVFTSGGTESDNLAIAGMIGPNPAGAHIITTSIEHPAVLETCRELERRGASVTYLSVDSSGVIDPAELHRQIRPNTLLISIMHANNEVGVIQPLKEIAAVVRGVRERGQLIYLHSDGVQTSGRISVNVLELGVDLYSFSAHKVNGPKGIGALFVRKGVPLRSIQSGGRHERERRPGTENVPAAAAFAEALTLAIEDGLGPHLENLRDRFEGRISSELDGIRINGQGACRLPNTSNIQFETLEGAALVIALDLRGFAVSSGAACSSGAVEPSHVLLAMGQSKQEARSSVRFSFGRGNTAESTDALASAVIESVRQLRASHRGREPQHTYVSARD